MEEYVWISKLAHHPVYVNHTHRILKRLAEYFNMKVSIAGPDNAEDEPYIEAIHQAAARKVAGIMLVGWNSEGLIEAVDAVIDHGIPLVTVDCDVSISRRLAHVGTDWYKMGVAMADRLAKMIDFRGRVLFMGMYHLENMNAGFRGFYQHLFTFPDIEIFGPENDFDADSQRAEEITARYLEDYKDLTAIAGFDWNSGPGIARALEKAGLEKRIKVVCVEADEMQLKHIQTGAIDAAYYQKREAFTYQAFQMLYAYNHGSVSTGNLPGLINIPGNIDTGHFVVTPKNFSTFKTEFDIEEAIARHELSQQFTFLSSMIENIAEITLAAGNEGRIVYANPAASKALGYSKAEMVNHRAGDVFELNEEHKSILAACIDEGRSASFEAHTISRQGDKVPVQVTVSPLYSDKKIRGMVVIAFDISERKQAEDERRKYFQARIEAEKKYAEAVQLAEETARMASVGVMAAGITHEINQPLSAIQVHADTALYLAKEENYDIPYPITKIFQDVSEGARRISKIIQHMKSYWVSPYDEALEKIDVNEAVRNAVSLVNRRAFSHSAALETVLRNEPTYIMARSVQMEQIVINLVTNAIQSLDLKNSADKRITIRTAVDDNEAVLEVSDSGIGLPLENLEELFDPFVSTNKRGEGMGLGLAIVKKFADNFNGKITALNNNAGGATFTIRFPLVEAV